MKRSAAVNLVLLPLISPILLGCSEDNPQLPTDILSARSTRITARPIKAAMVSCGGGGSAGPAHSTPAQEAEP